MGFANGGEDTRYKDTVGTILGGLVNAEGGWEVVCKVGGLTDIQRNFFRDNTDYFIGRVFTAHGYCFYPSGAIRHPKEDCTFEQIPESYSMSASPAGKSTEVFERDHRMASGRIKTSDLTECDIKTTIHKYRDRPVKIKAEAKYSDVKSKWKFV